METVKLKRKVQFTDNGNLVQSDLIVLKSLKPKDRFLIRKINELCGNEKFTIQNKTKQFQNKSADVGDVGDVGDVENNIWQVMIDQGFVSANFITEIEKILLDNKLIFFKYEDREVFVGNKYDEFSIEDANLIVGRYLDVFFTI